MSSVYTFGPTFRAEKSHTRRHLSEFYMVEAETVTLSNGLPGLLDLINDLHTHVVAVLLKENSVDLKLYHDKSPHTKASEVPQRNFNYVLVIFKVGLLLLGM